MNPKTNSDKADTAQTGVPLHHSPPLPDIAAGFSLTIRGMIATVDSVKTIKDEHGQPVVHVTASMPSMPSSKTIATQEPVAELNKRLIQRTRAYEERERRMLKTIAAQRKDNQMLRDEVERLKAAPPRYGEVKLATALKEVLDVLNVSDTHHAQSQGWWSLARHNELEAMAKDVLGSASHAESPDGAERVRLLPTLFLQMPSDEELRERLNRDGVAICTDQEQALRIASGMEVEVMRSDALPDGVRWTHLPVDVLKNAVHDFGFELRGMPPPSTPR